MSQAKKFIFTISAIKDIPSPSDKEREYYRDAKLDGLILDVTKKGTKTFRIYRKFNGRPIRPTIGKFPDINVDQARKMGSRMLADIANGINPIQAKRDQDTRDVTLKQVFDDLMANRTYKPRTIQDYTYNMDKAFYDWHSTPIHKISRDAVIKRYRKLCKASPTRANNAMRVLKAMFNFAKGYYEDDNGKILYPDNPVDKIGQIRAWIPNKRRQIVIQREDLKPWFKAVQKHDMLLGECAASTSRDYLILVLLTGLRREEAMCLEWGNIELNKGTLTVLDTKNHDDLTLPVSDYVLEILKRRSETCKGSKFVFPGTGITGHLVTPENTVKRVRDESGVYFSIHDLRRTFVTIAESLDISSIAIKRLVNHRSNRQDVTAGYVIFDQERLRKPMQSITDFILEQAGVYKDEA